LLYNVSPIQDGGTLQNPVSDSPHGGNQLLGRLPPPLRTYGQSQANLGQSSQGWPKKNPRDLQFLVPELYTPSPF
jgi:hypothetical protein